MKTNIYILTDTSINNVVYVGQTDRELRIRLSEHKYRFKNKNLSIELIDIADDGDVWEKHYIPLYKSWGFNLKQRAFGGKGSSGVKFSNEEKKIYYSNRKGNPNYCLPKGPKSKQEKIIIKQSCLTAFEKRLNITKELVLEVNRLILIDNYSFREVGKKLNIPPSRV